MSTQTLLKKLCVHSPLRYSERLDALLRLTLLKPWIAQHQPHPYLASREHLYAHVADNVIGPRPIAFLEFGVYQGASLRTWTQLDPAAQSEFIGFDSFEGLPEAWVNVRATLGQGSFSTGGTLPVLEDTRVRLVKGWFRDTLPGFLEQFSTDKLLVVHCDADVYSSTLFALCQLDKLLQPGAIVFFDDFSSMLHDFRALEDYTRAFGREYTVLGAAGRSYYKHVAIRFTA
jgi:macrocin-O-methyltransferase TylF-like protien